MKKPYLHDRFSLLSVLQALMAMGSQMEECGSAMEALRADVKKGTYHNPMAVSQVLPALHQRTYLHLKSQECRSENGMYNMHASSVKYQSAELYFVLGLFFQLHLEYFNGIYYIQNSIWLAADYVLVF